MNVVLIKENDLRYDENPDPGSKVLFKRSKVVTDSFANLVCRIRYVFGLKI